MPTQLTRTTAEQRPNPTSGSSSRAFTCWSKCYGFIRSTSTRQWPTSWRSRPVMGMVAICPPCRLRCRLASRLLSSISCVMNLRAHSSSTTRGTSTVMLKPVTLARQAGASSCPSLRVWPAVMFMRNDTNTSTDEPEQLVKTPAKPFVRDISMMNAYIVDDSLMQFQDLYLPVQPSPSITPPSLTSRSPAAPTPETLTSDELQSHLVDLYFAWDNPWHNILNEGRFRYAMKHNTKCFSLLLLNSVLAMGSRYSDRIDVRSDPADGNTAGQPYLEVAEKLIQKELHHPRMATVQSLAIMGVLYAVGCSHKHCAEHSFSNTTPGHGERCLWLSAPRHGQPPRSRHGSQHRPDHTDGFTNHVR